MEISQDVLDKFKEVTTVNDDQARRFLVHCEGDLETAIQLFLQTGGTLENTHEGINNADNEEIELRRRNQHNGAVFAANPLPPPRRRSATGRDAGSSGSGWLNWLIAVVALPFRFTITTLWDIFNVFSQIFSSGARPALTDPRGDVARFRHDYQQHYAAGSEHTIEFYQGSYDDALREAKSSLRQLLVYLHNPNHKDTVRFVSDILHSAQMADLIQSKNLLVFGVSLSSPQGAALSASIRPNGYPFLAMLSLRNNKMSVIIRLSGLSDAESTCLNLRIAVEDSQAQLNILRMQKLQREEDQRIRAEQEREYKESAAKDKARFQERRRLESEKAEAEELEKQREQHAKMRKEEVAARKAELRARLEPEVAAGQDTVRVQVRFPNGSRFDRRFSLDDSLEVLFAATLAQEKCPDFITFHTTYPRKQLLCAPEWYHKLRSIHLSETGESDGVNEYTPAKTFREEGLEKSLVVMVHDCEA